MNSQRCVAAPADQALTQQIGFIKNVTIMGGLLMVWTFGPDRIALDRERA
jgi:uncharacterized membrane protein YphA (DoxX/SURF4 family)